MLAAAQETAAQETAALAHRGGGCRQLARHQVQAGWGCEWLLKAAAANAEEVGTYLVQCGVW